ncbi:helix-turn-helix domain-containing protein [Caulobacter soli]|uniref:helix-turn-helix domain-containing protein n=1 Tax=Caulobacter soli TaxID=2708539 RepID=UPI0013ECF58C|nr:helix-turn-helix domain-containing protein [Caulobacter soli]
MDLKFLTTEEVSQRYRGLISVGTLENWRFQQIGPSFLKVGKQVLYPVEVLDAWERSNMVTCKASKVVGRRRLTSPDI